MKKIVLTTLFVILAIMFTGCKAQEITGGNIHIQNGEYDEAINQFKIATEKYPDKAGPWVSLSVPYYLKKEYKKSAKALDEAYKINSKDAQGRVEWYEDFLRKEDYRWRVFYNGAVRFNQDGDFDKAIEYVEKSIKTEDPEKKSYSYNLMGNLNISKGENEEAVKNYKKSIDVYGKIVEPYLSLGGYYLINGMNEEAITYCKKALKVDSTRTRPYVLLGQAYLNLEDYANAKEMLQIAASKFPEDEKILYNLALAHLKSNDYKATISVCRKILELEVEPAIKSRSYNLYGQAYIEQEEYEKAIKVLKEGVESNPNNCEAYHLIAIAYKKLGNKTLTSKFAEDWDRCLERSE